jgi:hypothetical protein
MLLNRFELGSSTDEAVLNLERWLSGQLFKSAGSYHHGGNSRESTHRKPPWTNTARRSLHQDALVQTVFVGRSLPAPASRAPRRGRAPARAVPRFGPAL